MITKKDVMVDNFCGIITLSAIKEGYYFKKRYQFYTLRSAMKDFLREANGVKEKMWSVNFL